MKIYNRENFMKLPIGTLFCKGDKWVFYNFSRKGETITWEDKNIDWYFQSFEWIESEDSLSDFDQMFENNISLPMNESECRDGSFSMDDVFLVFEKKDLLKLRDYINHALDLT